MKQFYGIYKKNNGYVLSLTGYAPDMMGDINPYTGKATHFKEIKRVGFYTKECIALLECKRLNIKLMGLI